VVFNVLQGRSSEWGTEPPTYYFVKALPKLLTGTLALAAAAPFVERRAARPLAVGLGYVAVYSLLPHKEVRFLFPAVPLLTAAGACAFAAAWRRRGVAFDRARDDAEGWGAQILILCCALAAVTSAVPTWMGVLSSSLNYPGGEMFRRLHRIGCPEAHRPCRVHVGGLAAQTGVTRFGEAAAPGVFVYSKEERLAPADLASRDPPFDYLIAEAGAEVPGFRAYGTLSGFSGWRFEFPCGTQLLDAALCPVLQARPPVFALVGTQPRLSLLVRDGLPVYTPEQAAAKAQVGAREAWVKVYDSAEAMAAELGRPGAFEFDVEALREAQERMIAEKAAGGAGAGAGEAGAGAGEAGEGAGGGAPE